MFAHDSMICRVGLVMITLVVEFHLGLLVEVEESGLREWSTCVLLNCNFIIFHRRAVENRGTEALTGMFCRSGGCKLKKP